MSVIDNSLLLTAPAGGGSYQVSRSLRFNAPDSSNLTRTPSTASNRRTFTWSGWVKRSGLGGDQQLFFAAPSTADTSHIRFDSDDTLNVFEYAGSYTWRLQTTQVFRDCSAWYHILVSIDTTQATSSNRVKIYVNGVQVTTFSTASYPTLNTETEFNNTVLHGIGRNPYIGNEFNGYLADIHFIDGQSLDPSSFTTTDLTTGQLIPKLFVPTSPNNGTTWSGYLTTNAGSNFDGSYPVANAFDSSTTTKALTANNGNGTTTGTSYIQFNSPTGFTGNLKVVCDSGNAVYNVSGGGSTLLATNSSGTDGYMLDCGSVTNITSIRVLMSGGSRPAIGGILIDGVLLVDGVGQWGRNGFKLNFSDNSTTAALGTDTSGSAAPTVANGTGGLPIFNTTDTYGTVKGSGTRADTSASSLSLCVPMGTASGLSLTDEQPTGRTSSSATLANTGVTNRTSVSKFYGGSALFSSSRLDTTATSDFLFGTGDFTVEGWFYQTTANSYPFALEIGDHLSNNGIAFITKVTGPETVAIYSGSFYGSAPVALNVWNHIVWMRASGVLKIYVNGILSSSSTFTNNLTNTTGNVTIGAKHDGGSGYYFPGYMQDLRVYKGLAKYTSNFNPPASPNSWTVNNLAPGGANYSSRGSLSASPPTLSGTIADIFDGSLASSGGSFSVNQANAGVTVSFSPALPSGSTVKLIGNVYGTAGSNSSLQVNGTSYAQSLPSSPGTGTDTILSVPAGTGGITSIYIYREGVSTFNYSLYGITVDDVLLVDGAAGASLVDTPTSYGTDTGVGNEVRGNYCTLNPLDSGGGTVSNGNLEHTYNSSNLRVKSTISIPATGKWYAEFVASNAGGGNSLVGIATGASALTGSNWYLGNDAGSWGLQIGSGTMYTYHNGAVSSFGTANNGDVIGVAVDRAAGKIWWSVNNTWIASGNPANGTNARYSNVPATDTLFFALSNSNSSSIVCNFGQRAFAYTAPSGFKALVDTNLPEPVVAKGSSAMDVKLYTGNGGTQTISGLEFGPDFVWLKRRDAARNHALYDVVRGVKKYLASDSTSAEYEPASGGVSSFDASSFTVVEQGGVAINESSASMVAWTWDAGASTVTNTAGSITSQVRANPSAGFSVVTWTGTGSSATVGHGLGVAPSMVIAKRRDAAGWDWPVWHTKLTSGVYSLFINNTNAEASRSDIWSSAPSSTVFNFGNSGQVNGSGGTYVCYAFSPVSGYSSAFSYTGNGDSSGPFVYLGFRPRFIIQKRTDSAGSWLLIDTARDPVNVARNELFANAGAAEYDNGSLVDVLSNGFKIRATFANMNASGGSFIGYAFAENPFQYARAR